MNPAEKIQAAIEKLEAEREASTRGEWIVYGAVLVSREVLADDAIRLERIVILPHSMRPADSKLIVTLHRTIDAQLGILRGTLKWIGAYPTPGSLPQAAEDVVALASAILGEDS